MIAAHIAHPERYPDGACVADEALAAHYETAMIAYEGPDPEGADTMKMHGKLQALVTYMNDNNAPQEEINEAVDDFDETSQTHDIPGQEVRILNEAEREEAIEETLDNYLDECILPELPESMRGYFDAEKWKRDARMEGAGHLLNSYDGTEHEHQDTNGVWWFLYRTN